ncbi:MAG: hypothetical protein K2W95_18985 [Candidatus Obscuribacterales bacterium]|nr:hypothetical protein [Candidatus Obscuribacterales bacterium]
MVEFMENAREPASGDRAGINLLALTISDKLSSDANSFVGNFCQAFTYTLVQAPVEGVAQLLDGEANGKTKQTVHFMDAPEAAPFGSADWVAQQSGSALGAVVPVLLIHKGVSTATQRSYSLRAAIAMGDHLPALTARQALTAGGAKLAESALIGSIYSGFFTPARVDEKDFWSARARSGASGGMAFASLTGFGLALKLPAVQSVLPTALRSEVAAGILSGFPAGLVAVNAESILDGHGLAPAEQQLQSALTFAITAGGTAHGKSVIAELAPAKRITASTGQFKSIGMDVDGRPIAKGHRAKVTANWKESSPAELLRARSQTLTNLARIEALEPGKTVLDQFKNSGLSISSKYRVLSSLGELRDYLAKHPENQADTPLEQNRLGKEQGRVMDAARVGNLSAIETEDALHCSMFTEAGKTGDVFFTPRQRDAALLADHVLSKELGAEFTRTRLDGIVHAIREQQPGPPEFMAALYGHRLRGAIKTNSQETALRSLIGKMADPLNPATEKTFTPDGGTALKLTAQERALLQTTGNNHWEVPDEANPWNRSSRAVFDGTSMLAPSNVKAIRLDPPSGNDGLGRI